MAINFPNSPQAGDPHSEAGIDWVYDGEKWVAQSEATFWARAGSTLSPSTAGDNISTTGDLSAAAGTFAGGELTIDNGANKGYIIGTPGNGASNGWGRLFRINEGTTAEQSRLDLIAGSATASNAHSLNIGKQKGDGSGVDYNTTLSANGDVSFGGKILTPGMSATASAGGALKIIGNEIFRDSSARGTKENIVSLKESDSVAVTKGLRPVNYTPKGEPDGHLQIGFIAEEVLAVCPPAAITENGEAIGVAYDRLTAICISALQASFTRIEALEAEVQALKGGI